MRFLLITLLILLSCIISVNAQKKIYGTIKGNAGNLVELATVTLRDGENNILKYTSTNPKGEYSFTLDSIATNLKIEVTCVGYEKSSITIAELNKAYDIVLNDSKTLLKEVKIKYKPSLNVNGDTINYRASDFADKQDKSIGDVLKKMPGITVDDDGKISYNGKAISSFYIDGDNLLDDRYNIASRGIPYGAVDQVQVIQNDQPVKILRKNNISDDVALNLKIKNGAKLHVLGEETIGAGTPGKFYEDGTAILLTKKLKFINNISGNNTGIDPAIDITGHSSPSVSGNYFLSTGAAGVPELPQERTLFNKAGLINLNNLYNLTSTLQLKSNISYLYEEEQQNYQKLSETYLPGQTITYTEGQNNSIKLQKLHTLLTFLQNGDHLYFTDNLAFDYNPNTITSNLIINNVYANQFLSQHTFNVSNVFKYVVKFRSGQLINIYSNFTNTNKPERLTIMPGLDSAVFNNSIPYAGLDQYIKIPTIYTTNTASFSIVKGNFTQGYTLGFDLQHQQLNSDLYKIQNDQSRELVSSNAINDLNWIKTKFYAGPSYNYTSSKITAVLNLPVSFNDINYNDNSNALSNSFKKLFFDPYFHFVYQTSPENSLTVNYNFTNITGLITDVYLGAILKNYRSLYDNNAPISSYNTQSVSVTYNFTRPIDMLFVNLSTVYNVTNFNNISSSILTNNIEQRIVLSLPNVNRYLSTNVNVSKYIFDLGFTVNGGFVLKDNWNELLQNNKLFPSFTQTLTYKAGLTGKLVRFINWLYSINYSTSTSKPDNAVAVKTSQLRQKSTLSFTTVKNVYFNLSGDYLYTSQPGEQDLKYLFVDMNINYKLIKLKTDIMFSVNNIANVKTFNTVSLTDNALTRGSFAIPGRIAMLKCTFNF
ncbi:MAG TPA: carboxypeptidase-like regulatory domain-containing protein [Mucilaginibacter sp.]|jgi:hypothetical protein|nr:carboxypeptidase-like regulatory domain-containing protein [Mucilaginibacter sp.]